MKKKWTTIVLTMILTMLLTTVGVFAVGETDNSGYWEVTVTEVTDSSAVIVWNPVDHKDYKHSEDVVFNIYKVNDAGEKELLAKVVDKEDADEDDQSDVYVYNLDRDAKDDSGKDVPLGYSYTAEDLDPDTDYELIVEKDKNADEKEKSHSGIVEFTTKPAADSMEEGDETGPADKTLKTKSVDDTAYTLSEGTSVRNYSTSAVFTWKMDRGLTDGAKIDINGYKITPKDNGDGTYSYTVTGLDPASTYSLPVKAVSKSGSILSNVINVKVETFYQLSAGTSVHNYSTSAVFTWKMDRRLGTGDMVDINGYRVTPKDNGDGTYSYTVTGLDPASTYSLPVKAVSKSGKALSNVMNVKVETFYQLSAGTSKGKTPSSAVFTWKMERKLGIGDRVDINGYMVMPKDNGDGTYSYTVTGFDPGSTYSIPVKVVSKNGKSLSNVIIVKVENYYQLSNGKSIGTAQTSAKFTWKMNRKLTGEEMVDINGYRVTPKDNGDGTYSYNVTGFDPGSTYSIPVKVVDKNGKTISNVLNIEVGTYFQLTGGKTADETLDSAKFTWKMNRKLSSGEKVDINGYKVTPKDNGDGTYSYRVSGFDPASTYSIPVKVVDKNGKTISNVMIVRVGTYYQLTEGKPIDETPFSAVFNWRMNRTLSNGEKVNINGYSVNPTKNKDGTYSYTVTGLGPSSSYNFPVKVIDKNGRTISNVLNIAVKTPYTLSDGKSTPIKGGSSVLSWRMSHTLKDGAKIDINGYKVNPTKNSDGTYSFTVTGFDPEKTYSIPIKVVDKNGRQVSNILTVQVENLDYQIKTMQVQFTFSRDRDLTSHSGGSVTTHFSKGYTTLTTGYEAGYFWFNYGGRAYRVQRDSSTTNLKIATSGFDKTYSSQAATNYVNSLNISSNTGMLVWVSTYTQKEYIFTGSKNNWRLVNGPWSVSTGLPQTMTTTGLGYIKQKAASNNGLPYWSVVSDYSLHGKAAGWTLGYPASNGCVRNTNDHAYYIYYSCPIGTAVYVY